MPLSSLLIETDSPVLGPIRDERNEPANTVYVVKAVSEIKGVSEEEVIETTCFNAGYLYGDRLSFPL
ncbi:TatD family hydrolase [Thermodesulfobacteriota bacterium]